MDSYLTSFKALADETRLRIVSILQAGAFNVNEIVGILGMGQSRVSRHLKILADADLVETRREGSRAYYRLSALWDNGGDSGSGKSPLRYLRLLGRELKARLNGDGAAVEECLRNRRVNAEQFFREVAGHWDAHRADVEGPPDHLEPLARLVENLGEIDTLVDLGTGTGVLLPGVRSRARRVIGIDASPEMLQMARRRVAEAGWSNVDLRLGALEHLPILDGEADVMVANMVLHHVASPPYALREVHRGLRPGGAFLIADFRAHEEESYRDKLGDLWLGFEGEDLETWLDESGFDVEFRSQWIQTPSRPTVMLLLARRRQDRS